jgi:mannose-1-phosphate guanylyltransferase
MSSDTPFADHLWVVVLAAGNGKRVADLTRDAAGRSVPKQYADLNGGPTLLDLALHRAQRLVPLTQTVVIVAEPHREFWRPALVSLPQDNIVAQPEDRGTAGGILLALQKVLAHDPEAHLVFLPCDHFVQQEARLAESILGAVEAAAQEPSRLVLLGMPCSAVDDEYGWIVPARASGPVRGVAAFHEKPERADAERLRREGALLNTFILATTRDALVAVYERTLPGLLAAFETALGDNLYPQPSAVAALYSSLPTTDFSRDVLERVSDRLLTFAAQPCGWIDLGTPARLERHRRRRCRSRSSLHERPPHAGL